MTFLSPHWLVQHQQPKHRLSKKQRVRGINTPTLAALKNTRMLVIASLLATLAIGALTGCHKNDTVNDKATANKNTPNQNANSTAAPTANQIQLLKSDILTASTSSYQPTVPITGTLQAKNKTPVQAVVNSQVIQVLAKVGDKVQKGQRLIILNIEDSKNKLAQARADVLGSQAQANVAQTLAAKNKILLDKGFVAQIEYQRSLADAQAQAEQVKAKQAQLNIAQKMYGDMNINAPITGIVASRNVEVGQVVGAGGTLMELIDPSQLEFAASVPSEAQGQLTIGQAVPFSVGNSPASDTDKLPFVGQISRISPEVDATTRQLIIYISVNPNQNNQQLKAGMFATGKISYGNAQNGILLPANAVLSDSIGTVAGTNMGTSIGANSSTPKSANSPNATSPNSTQNNAFIWTITPEQKLQKQTVSIIKRYENTAQILVSGVAVNTPVVLVPLAGSDAGKTVVVK